MYFGGVFTYPFPQFSNPVMNYNIRQSITKLQFCLGCYEFGIASQLCYLRQIEIL